MWILQMQQLQLMQMQEKWILHLHQHVQHLHVQQRSLLLEERLAIHRNITSPVLKLNSGNRTGTQVDSRWPCRGGM